MPLPCSACSRPEVMTTDFPALSWALILATISGSDLADSVSSHEVGIGREGRVQVDGKAEHSEIILGGSPRRLEWWGL